jgi:hypothetical protein
MGVGAGSPGKFVQKGGLVALEFLFVGTDVATATATLSAGQLTTLGEEIGGRATFTQTGGSHTASMNMEIRTGGKFKFTGGTLYVQRNFTSKGQFDFGNSTVAFTAGDNSFVDFSKGSVLNATNATINGGAGSFIAFPAGFDPLLNLGRLSTSGIVQVAGQPLTIPATKSISGSGTITGNVLNQGLISPGNSPGHLVIDGDLIQAATGSLLMELAGNSSDLFDSISITGTVGIAGQLQVTLLEGFVPSSADQFVILTGNSLSGAFTNAASRLTLPSGHFDVFYSSTAVTLTNFAPAAVPEPSALAGLALLPLVGRRCRSTRSSATK